MNRARKYQDQRTLMSMSFGIKPAKCRTIFDEENQGK